MATEVGKASHQEHPAAPAPTGTLEVANSSHQEQPVASDAKPVESTAANGPAAQPLLSNGPPSSAPMNGDEKSHESGASIAAPAGGILPGEMRKSVEAFTAQAQNMPPVAEKTQSHDAVLSGELRKPVEAFTDQAHHMPPVTKSPAAKPAEVAPVTNIGTSSNNDTSGPPSNTESPAIPVPPAPTPAEPVAAPNTDASAAHHTAVNGDVAGNSKPVSETSAVTKGPLQPTSIASILDGPVPPPGPVSGTKRKADELDESMVGNGDTPEAKKAKGVDGDNKDASHGVEGVPVPDAAGAANGDDAAEPHKKKGPGRPRKDRKIKEPVSVVGRTTRKTRSQGPAEGL